jgi:hypothetical protein
LGRQLFSISYLAMLNGCGLWKWLWNPLLLFLKVMVLLRGSPQSVSLVSVLLPLAIGVELSTTLFSLSAVFSCSVVHVTAVVFEPAA